MRIGMKIEGYYKGYFHKRKRLRSWGIKSPSLRILDGDKKIKGL